MNRPRQAARAIARHPWRVAAVAIALNVVALAALVIALLPRDGPADTSGYDDLLQHRDTRAAVHGEPKPPSVLGDATPAPAIETFAAPVATLRIPSIHVDARVDPMGVTADGTMESPRGPDVVAWYAFTAKPGTGGNAVLSGHVDYVNYGPAVFWDLRKLAAGAEIDVDLADGTVLQYAVTASQLYPEDQVPMADVLAPTATESITLITCGGTFSGGSYSDRLVLRAVRSGVIKPGT